MKHPAYSIVEAQDEPYLSEFRRLLREYTSTPGIRDMYFAALVSDIRQFPSGYGRPSGRLFLARSDHQIPIGICALRPCPQAMVSNAAEMKHLYVQPAYRRKGAGRDLTDMAIEAARAEGYEFLLLDTLDDMEAARGMYAEMGFIEVAPYFNNPSEGTHYLQLHL
jgi:ribosomal protein S18 acetylase RimI-like enzyme